MKKTRCLIADIPQGVLADILQKILEIRPGVDVAGCVESSHELPEYLKNNAIDVVIHSMEATRKSQLLDEILQRSPETVSVGLQDGGRVVCICVGDVSPELFLDLIEGVSNIRRKTYQT